MTKKAQAMSEIVKKSENDKGIVLDSLPYVEEVHEDYEEYALALIDEEMKAITPRPLKKIPPLRFRTSTMKNEYETLVKTDGETALFMPRSKVQLQLFQPAKIVKPTTIEQWEKSSAISQIKSRYESERIRGLVLEAKKEEEVINWKDYIADLDDLEAFWKNLLQKQHEAVEEINFQRERAQTQQVGPELDRLNEDYQQVLYRRNQLEHAIEGLRRGNSPSNATRKRKTDEI